MLSVERFRAHETLPLPAVGARRIITDFFKKNFPQGAFPILMIGVSLIRLYIFGFPKKFIPFATAALLILTACTASFAAVSQAPPTPDIHRIADIFEPLSRPAELLLEPTHLVFLTNRANHTLIGPFKTGIFLGNCVEYCGTQHANMFMRAIVQTPEDFQKWMDNQKRLSAEPQDGIAVQEKKIFMTFPVCLGTRSTRRPPPELPRIRRKIFTSALMNPTPSSPASTCLPSVVKNPQQPFPLPNNSQNTIRLTLNP